MLQGSFVASRLPSLSLAWGLVVGFTLQGLFVCCRWCSGCQASEAAPAASVCSMEQSVEVGLQAGGSLRVQTTTEDRGCFRRTSGVQSTQSTFSREQKIPHRFRHGWSAAVGKSNVSGAFAWKLILNGLWGCIQTPLGPIARPPRRRAPEWEKARSCRAAPSC